ncbi:GntR family transcriptional regulator [Clostridium psychrophilum]|nr:GntR family transcriptional regulator [Clostridium psychrophilum]
MIISEIEILEKFNVSRTPVREAFARLSQEGLISVYPQKGTFVSLIDLLSVEEARFMREHLERAILRLACENFPKEIIIEHLTMVNFDKNQLKQDYTSYFK